jgi:hypothetical protein
MLKLLRLISPILCCITLQLNAQTNIVTYAGNGGKECFYDVMQITDGSFLVCGYADNLSWVPASATNIILTYPGHIPNSLNTNKYGFILHLSPDLQQVLQVIHFPQGIVEDIRFMKTNTQPYTATGDLYISANTADTDPNNGGYIIGKLDHNFIDGIPSALTWMNVVWAKSGPKDYHPWDVTGKGEVYYISGEAHGYDWSAIYCLDANGKRKIVNNWRTHWLKNGTEWKGTPASAAPGGIDSVNYSGIALKYQGRCELRSWTMADYLSYQPDGNGGMKQGKWPADFLFNGPCDPTSPTAVSPGYTGYSTASCCPVFGGSCIAIDKKTDQLYIGMNFKSTAGAAYGHSPDFEPAVIAMDTGGALRWWSRLYHEVTPAGDTVESIPDQYIDALAIDYAHNKLVVGARCHGNNTENFWEGNTVHSDTSAYGFQNQFTGTFGNIHESWLGKLKLSDGTLTNSTYMAELFEGTGSLGTPHPDPNMDGWPNPNTGWPDVNTTRLAKNNMKVSSDGSVAVIAVGRRTATTRNAYQRNISPYSTGHGCWNSFVRVYDPNFHVPLYSSLVVGQWDTITQAGGSNTDLFGVYKTSRGVIAVGRHTADTSGMAIGNNIPVINVTPWGNATPSNESAILVYYQASNLYNNNDSINGRPIGIEAVFDANNVLIYPNPATQSINIDFGDDYHNEKEWQYSIINMLGSNVMQGELQRNKINLSSLNTGVYQLQLSNEQQIISRKLMIAR